jgi:hypothetical protein
MSPTERAHPGADMERFVREQMAFMGLAETDIETIRRTAPLVLKHEAALTEALYDHFLRFPETAQFFVGEDGAPDLPRLERRKHSLGRWLRETAGVAMTHGRPITSSPSNSPTATASTGREARSRRSSWWAP